MGKRMAEQYRCTLMHDLASNVHSRCIGRLLLGIRRVTLVSNTNTIRWEYPSTQVTQPAGKGLNNLGD
ncbi:hypothetical protein M0802_001045 [Mischocyttarus mexicanus]|nr:hypothetical protein M0802_001045 [Mischocyttarus mexicanus]